MLCIACNKESNNLRVCPYCFTPYPPEPAPGARTSTRMSATSASPKPGGAGKSVVTEIRGLFMRQSLVVRLSALGIAVVGVLWIATGSSGGSGSPGAASPAIIATPLQRDDALAIIKQTRESALVDVQQDEVFVSYPAATFPLREEGQRALVEQFAEADGIVEGRKRRIFFYNPNGKLFAQSDASRGVIIVR